MNPWGNTALLRQVSRSTRVKEMGFGEGEIGMGWRLHGGGGPGPRNGREKR